MKWNRKLGSKREQGITTRKNKLFKETEPEFDLFAEVLKCENLDEVNKIMPLGKRRSI